jgi:hypothetical protein
MVEASESSSSAASEWSLSASSSVLLLGSVLTGYNSKKLLQILRKIGTKEVQLQHFFPQKGISLAKKWENVLCA